MQTLTIGAYRATLAPTRDVGAFQAKLAKCNGKSRRLPLRDLRTKAGFPVFEPGMSTAEYVRLYSSGDGSQLKAWEWAQLNDAPCALYCGEDTCETLPDGFDTWEDFDAAQGSSTAAESAPANAEPVDAAEPVAPDDAIAPAIVAGAEPDAPTAPARAEPYPGCEPQRMADAMRARIAPTADALREAAAELEARAARVPSERADDYRSAAAMLRADADAAPGIVPGFASRGARMLQAAIARSAARGIEDPNGAPVAAVESDAPAVDSGPPASDSSAEPAEVKREADRAAALADAMARFTRGARVTAEPAHYFDGRPVAGWPSAQFLGTVRECFDNRGMATVRVKWDSGRTDLTSAARLAIVPLPGESGTAPAFDAGRVSLILHNVLVPLQNAAPDGVPSVAGLESEAARLDASAAIMAGDDYADDAQRRCGTRIAADYREVARSLRELAEIERDRIDDIEGVDETIPAPLDGLDVAELDDMAEFERAGGIAQPIAAAYRDDAPRATPTPSLRISPSDPRARIPARFAPVYLLQA